jgi:hypothetical protein
MSHVRRIPVLTQVNIKKKWYHSFKNLIRRSIKEQGSGHGLSRSTRVDPEQCKNKNYYIVNVKPYSGINQGKAQVT